MKLKIAATFFLLLLLGALQAGAMQKPPQPKADAKCPVCGMFVAKYPEWVASLTFQDSTTVFFDGAKDLFTYYFNMKKYGRSRTTGDVSAVIFKDYYDLKPIDGKNTFFVLGSDVFGPMGKELIPFRSEADAREFLKDHKGKQVVPFARVTPALLKTME